ncbi:prepilin-type N-terminal cleavage/methylation domain-containing protein [Rhodoferax aquaticus]|uniref:Prepilin-type N-terminal cleavage/methylation domain-containing protein n=1 Tax=Rhodoferax aquaticus TaxID=2527691 RepID=A0A515ENJ2_9BURK|nr:prepilin-type N-terminal cleavage/methylation domain-containing protein [Rhodoferax aquaticus]QDL54236.1 prepilin-type N-terminal cleavage/methylation domain-containing protein [Rhodoferax aquaticus]
MSTKEPIRMCRSNRGFTLVELLVALVLGLILVSGILSVLSTNKQSFQVTENIARIQENARVAFDVLSRDLKEAGETPCGSKLVANLVRLRPSPSTIPWWSDWNAGTVRGYSGTTNIADIVPFGTSKNNRVPNTDAILIMQSDSNSASILSHDATAMEMVLNSSTSVTQDDVVIACDLQSAAIFQVATFSDTSKILSYDKSFTALNCSNNLGYPTPVNCAAAPTKNFDITYAQIANLKTSFWYIGIGSNGKNSLYKKRITKRKDSSGIKITTDTDEVLTNIKDMKIQYLTKNVATNTLASSWINADNSVFDAGSGAWTESNDQQVVAVRFAITLQSENSISTSNTLIEKPLVYAVGLRSRDTLFQATP